MQLPLHLIYSGHGYESVPIDVLYPGRKYSKVDGRSQNKKVTKIIRRQKERPGSDTEILEQHISIRSLQQGRQSYFDII